MILLSFFITFWKISITPRNSGTILYNILPMDPFFNINIINKNNTNKNDTNKNMNTNKNITLSGVDERIMNVNEYHHYLDSEEKLLKKIRFNMKKQELLKILESNNNVYEKLQHVKENNYLFDTEVLSDSIQGTNLFKGNLMKDTDFDFFN